jgi:hypothetical protein
MFNSLLQGDEKKAWVAFCLLSTNFLGNNRAENYKEFVKDMLLYHKLGCNMSLKIQMLRCHFDFFPVYSDMISDEHGKRFHQKIARSKNGIRERGPLPCWLTTVGRSPEMLLDSYTSNRQSEVQTEVDFYRYMSDAHSSEISNTRLRIS